MGKARLTELFAAQCGDCRVVVASREARENLCTRMRENQGQSREPRQPQLLLVSSACACRRVYRSQAEGEGECSGRDQTRATGKSKLIGYVARRSHARKVTRVRERRSSRSSSWSIGWGREVEGITSTRMDCARLHLGCVTDGDARHGTRCC